jgi:hypothetical protein
MSGSDAVYFVRIPGPKIRQIMHAWSLPALLVASSLCAIAAGPPPNDMCDGAIPLTKGVPYRMSTADATGADEEWFDCFDIPVSHGVWFAFTPTNRANITVSTCGSTFDNVLQVYTGACDGLQIVMDSCSDEFFRSCPDSFVSFEGTAGTTYRILTGGYDESSFGTLNILVEQTCKVSLSAAQTGFASDGGEGSVTVTADTNCTWTVRSDSPWISILSATNGTGAGTVRFRVAPGGEEREGNVTINGVVLTIYQDAEPDPWAPQGLVLRGTYTNITSASTRSLAVSGHYVYTFRPGALQIIDVGNAADMRLVGSIAISNNLFGLTLSGAYAYVSAGDGGLQIIDVSDPTAPRRVGIYNKGGIESTAVFGDYAYVTCTEGLEVVDVRDPTNPQRMGGTIIPTNHVPWWGDLPIRKITVWNEYAFVKTSITNLSIFNVRDPRSPTHLVDALIRGENFMVAGDRVYAGWGALHILDVANPAAPRELMIWQDQVTETAWFNASTVTVSGRFAILGGESSGSRSATEGIDIVDVENPLNPLRVAWDFRADAVALALSGNFLYTIARDGLRVYEIQLSMPGAYFNYIHLWPQGLFLGIGGDLGMAVRVQKSDDLRNWRDWKGVVVTNGPTFVVDPDVNSRTTRFYRVGSP